MKTQSKKHRTYASALLIAASAIFVIVLLYIVVRFGGQGQTPYGVVSGRVKIGPLCPVERLNVTCGPSDIYSSRSIILNSALRSPVFVPLERDGAFSAQVQQGSYSVSLSNCTFIGCKYTLPITITIIGGRTTILNISIDTGIR